MKFIGTKLNMEQMWKNDCAFGVTLVRLEKGDIAAFKEDEVLKISGISKGKGFQGVVKRHGFHGGPKTHGQKNRLRMPGSIGSTAPQRVIPGRRMAGHIGMERVTVKNLTLVAIEPDKKILKILGAVPGNRGSRVEIYKQPPAASH